LRNFLITVFGLLFYIYFSDRLGFLICATLLIGVMMWALEVRAKLIVPVALITTLVIHFIFYKGLRVPLPWGILAPFQW
jgi:putative tricarboxylic transport membrane protein